MPGGVFSDNVCMKDRYTACIIGTGRIGFTLGFDKKREQPASHTMALLDNPRVSLIAACDRDEECLAAWKKYVAKKSRFRPASKQPPLMFKNTDELFSHCSPDIAVISVNEDSHLDVSLDVIAHKPRIVILEKPVALSVSDGNKILKASKKYGVPVLVNHERRFAEDYALGYEYMKKIGDVQKINAFLFSGMKLYDPAQEKTGFYSLLHDGTHLIDIVLYLLESLDSAKLSKPVITGLVKDKDNKKIIRAFSANFSSARVPDISFFMSGKSRFFGFEIEVIGTEGKITVGNGHAEFYRRAESNLYTGFYSLQKDVAVKVPAKTRYFSNMVKNAVDFLDGSAALKSTLETGIRVLKIIEEIKKQIAD